jgi:hypothetical protein
VPEYHDCQRFVNDKGDAFGSLIAIFASFRLDSVSDPSGGPYPADQVVTGRSDAQAAATILNYDSLYHPLRIEKGISCLYLFTTNGVWNARIVSVPVDSLCKHSMSANNGGSSLAVSVSPDSPGEKIPEVARWDWDEVNHEHYIGIRCGTHWCEVYNPSRPALSSSPRYAGSPLVRVKGWYDQQDLAVTKVGAGGVLVPGGIRGTIFPVGDLERNRLQDFDSTWKQVALVSLEDDSPPYHDKLNLIKGPAPLGHSEVWLCRGDWKACGLPSTGAANKCANTADPWWAKIVSGPETRYRCVIRRTHPGVPIPGAVRWRWQNTDEDMWIRCPTGCCEAT